MTYRVPAISAVQLRPKGLRILARAEQPPHAASVLWRPNHREKAGLGSGFVVYGRAVKVGGSVSEPVWSNGSGELRQRWPRVREGDRIVWTHGYGPSVELVDGCHFLIHEEGVSGVWEPEHEHAWRLSRPTETFWCECEERRSNLETRLPSCGDEATGPRVGWLEPDEWDCDEPLPPSNVRPYGRRVSVLVELPPMRDAGIWTPHAAAKDGPALGFVVYARVARTGLGANEACWLRDPATGRRVRDGQQRGAPVVRFSVPGRSGPEVRERPDPTKTCWVPTRTRAGERVVLGAGWEDVTGLYHEETIVANWTPAHACCVHVDVRTPAGFRCCSCGEPRKWYDEHPETPLVAEAIMGRDPTDLSAPEGDPAPSEDPDQAAMIYEGESER